MLGCQMNIREMNSDYEMEKNIICSYSLKKIMFQDNYYSLWMFLSQTLKTNCLDVCV